MKNRGIEACVYCGDVTLQKVRDHIIPASFTSSRKHYEDSSETVCACSECNQMLSDRLLTTVESRCDFIIHRIRGKYASCLRSANWSEEELNELGRDLRSKVKANIFLKNWVLSRIEHAENICFRGGDTPVKHAKIDSQRVYAIIKDYLDWRGTDRSFCREKSGDGVYDYASVKAIISEAPSVYYEVTQFKFNHRYKLDASLKKIREILRKERKD